MSKSVFLFLFLSSASSDSKAVMRMYARTNSGDKAKTIWFRIQGKGTKKIVRYVCGEISQPLKAKGKERNRLGCVSFYISRNSPEKKSHWRKPTKLQRRSNVKFVSLPSIFDHSVPQKAGTPHCFVVFFCNPLWFRTLALLIAHSTGVHGSSLILDGILSRSLSAFLSTDGYSLARSCQLAIEFRYVPTADVRLHDTIENGNGD